MLRGNLNDAQEVFPDTTSNEIVEIVYEGMKNNKIFPKVCKKFFGDAFS